MLRIAIDAVDFELRRPEPNTASPANHESGTRRGSPAKPARQTHWPRRGASIHQAYARNGRGIRSPRDLRQSAVGRIESPIRSAASRDKEETFVAKVAHGSGPAR